MILHFGDISLFERSARVPLLIVPPGPSRLGSVCRQPVELLGLYPTLLDVAGLPHPPGLLGTSLAPLLRDPEQRLLVLPTRLSPGPARY